MAAFSNLETFWQDAHYAAPMLGKSPGFAADKDQPLYDPKTMEEVTADSFAHPHLLAAWAFAAVALSCWPALPSLPATSPPGGPYSWVRWWRYATS